MDGTNRTAAVVAAVTATLRAAGFVAAEEEAEELVRAAPDGGGLQHMVDRRLTGEPLAWITGETVFCGLTVAIQPGVFVPRWQSEPLAVLAAQLLPPEGIGVDLCTGSGAVAMVMQAARPGASVVATEVDGTAARCARHNGVTVVTGDLDEPLPEAMASRVDVMTGVLPYVPTEALRFLPRDVQGFEPPVALDGGPGGMTIVSRAIRRSPRWVRLGGWLLLEIGGDQVVGAREAFTASGYGDVDALEDGDGDVRGIYGRRVA
ncbi:MAG: HemK/PrmC family methyltransferase [Acidimicrobiales bacterium]|jgi:release factor glutamine methyltransferase